VSLGLLIVRLVVGLTLAAHGAQKLFGWFGGPGRAGTAGFFGNLGFRRPAAMAVLAGAGELGGGVLFAAGLLTPLAAIAIAVVMLTAIWTVHLRNGFFSTAGGYEFNLVLIAVAVAVAATGPGRVSLDRALGIAGDLSGGWWAAAVALAAVAIAVVTLTAGREHDRLSGHPAR
jgi:putative oxidoreductase